MPKMLIVELKQAVRSSAIESANEHIEFTKASFPEWAKGHEEQLKEFFRHYAVIGANEAVNWLRRNGKIW